MIDSDIRTCYAGETIVSEGEAGEAMYVVLAGRAGVSIAGSGQVAALGVGEFFGEMAVIDAQPRSATVTALEHGTQVLEIDQARFIYLVSQQPAFALAVMAALSRRMRSLPATPAPRKEAGEAGYSAAAVMPGLWHLHPRGRTCNAYLITGRRRTVLVDTGLPSSYAGLADALRGIGHPPEEIDLVVLTHEHADQVGGAAFLPGRAIIGAHPLAANKLNLQDSFAMISGVIGEDVPPFHIDLFLPEGSEFDADPFHFQVMHTPGHTSGSLCLVDAAQEVLICGDMFHSGGDMGGIFPSGNISDYIASLERLRRLRLRLALPAHGPVSESPEADTETALLRAHALLRDTRALFQAMRGEAAFDRILRSVNDLNV